MKIVLILSVIICIILTSETLGYSQVQLQQVNNIPILPNSTQDILEIDLFQNTKGKDDAELFGMLRHFVCRHEIFSHKLKLIEKLNPESWQYNIESKSYKII